MNSMTGFGFCSIEKNDFKLQISIKSINSRFLDIKFYTPFYYMPLEPELKKIISSKIKRGYFVIRIDRFPQKPDHSIFIKWNKIQAQKWKNLYKKISKELNFKSELSLNDLINREGVVNLIEKPKDLELKEIQIVKNLFHKSLQACLKERKREGSVLKKDILSQLKIIQTLTQKIEKLNKKQCADYLKKKDSHIKHNNFKKDINLELEKFDTHEEIIRMKEHINYLKKIIYKSVDVGRKLDFYVQEILREINTIGSKSHLSELTLHVVSTKFALEKIKEQVQNVE
ncbi:MAG: DUF1732 domain-containing protein [Bdellovibrionaceae bacterium]|nr:DUF1732 domain-containing protein [Pseudobdellovibrionaceae bacterium]